MSRLTRWSADRTDKAMGLHVGAFFGDVRYLDDPADVRGC
jgi:hypothetical protein